MKSRKPPRRFRLDRWIFLLVLVAALLVPQVVAADDTEEVQQFRFLEDGHYGLVANGKGMLNDPPPEWDINLNVPGTGVRAAYLYWSGTAVQGAGDDTITLTRDPDGGGPSQTVVAEVSHGPGFWYDGYYYYVYVAEVTSFVLNGNHTYRVSDFNTDMRRRDGAGLMVVYEDASLPLNRVGIKDGLDRFYRGWGEGARGESAVNCFDLGTDESARDVDFTMFLGEIHAEEERRPSALWYMTGTEAESQPVDMINQPTGGPILPGAIELDGPPAPYPFESYDDPQWDTYANQVTVPAGDAWVCFQVESAVDADYQPASGMWMATGGLLELGAPPTGTIIVEKQTVPDGAAGNFVFTGDAAGTLQDGGTIVVTDLEPGTYTSTEADPSPYFDLTSIVCDDDNSSGDVGTRTATFNLEAGETVTCTFTNTLREEPPGTIIVEKQTVPDGAAGDFFFTGDAAGTLQDGGTIVVTDLEAGTYTSTEADPAPAFDLTSIVCDDDNSSGDVGTRTATFNLEAGETVKCTFTNTKREVPPPPPVVPEASTMVLLGSAAAGLAGYVSLQVRARRRKP